MVGSCWKAAQLLRARPPAHQERRCSRSPGGGGGRSRSRRGKGKGRGRERAERGRDQQRHQQLLQAAAGESAPRPPLQSSLPRRADRRAATGGPRSSSHRKKKVRRAGETGVGSRALQPIGGLPWWRGAQPGANGDEQRSERHCKTGGRTASYLPHPHWSRFPPATTKESCKQSGIVIQKSIVFNNLLPHHANYSCGPASNTRHKLKGKGTFLEHLGQVSRVDAGQGSPQAVGL